MPEERGVTERSSHKVVAEKCEVAKVSTQVLGSLRFKKRKEDGTVRSESEIVSMYAKEHSRYEGEFTEKDVRAMSGFSITDMEVTRPCLKAVEETSPSTNSESSSTELLES